METKRKRKRFTPLKNDGGFERCRRIVRCDRCVGNLVWRGKRPHLVFGDLTPVTLGRERLS